MTTTGDRTAEILQRIVRLETDIVEQAKRWENTVNDFKALLKSEIGELKSEQIAELRASIKDRDRTLAELENRIRATESAAQANAMLASNAINASATVASALEGVSKRMAESEKKITEFATGSSLINWAIRVGIAATGVGVGILGSRHLP